MTPELSERYESKDWMAGTVGMLTSLTMLPMEGRC